MYFASLGFPLSPPRLRVGLGWGGGASPSASGCSTLRSFIPCTSLGGSGMGRCCICMLYEAQLRLAVKLSSPTLCPPPTSLPCDSNHGYSWPVTTEKSPKEPQHMGIPVLIAKKIATTTFPISCVSCACLQPGVLGFMAVAIFKGEKQCRIAHPGTVNQMTALRLQEGRSSIFSTILLQFCCNFAAIFCPPPTPP